MLAVSSGAGLSSRIATVNVTRTPAARLRTATKVMAAVKVGDKVRKAERTRPRVSFASIRSDVRGHRACIIYLPNRSCRLCVIRRRTSPSRTRFESAASRLHRSIYTVLHMAAQGYSRCFRRATRHTCIPLTAGRLSGASMHHDLQSVSSIQARCEAPDSVSTPPQNGKPWKLNTFPPRGKVRLGQTDPAADGTLLTPWLCRPRRSGARALSAPRARAPSPEAQRSRAPRASAGCPLLLPRGRHPGLHEGGVRVPRQLRGLQEGWRDR